ncbi:tetratricopeptide repeat protein [Bythopirellula goksoeyrii]|uniref:Lipoprotein NlpI n=1 Tax=Bythopirellula goksoeyrii TaxID=1400387 RepID=A0A5B9QHG3_9BACT|nr:tetratricopeptide repeat protein [Bythopirellula goksoeyrii]QEG33661.1 lipoprotein NlpI [Bythopirellula goksoeyrii]
MNLRRVPWLAVIGSCVLALSGVFGPDVAQAESAGQADLDEALRLRVTAEGLPDLSQVIDRLQLSLDKGLEVEEAELAEQMVSDALMERASALMQVVNSNSIQDDRVKQILRLIVSDLRRVLAYDNPPPEANLMLGRLMALPGGDPHEARRLLGKYLEAAEIQDSQRAEAYMLRGQVQTDEEKALADFDEAIKLDPDNETYPLLRAVFLRNREKFDEALAAVDEMLSESPEDANAFILQGELFRQLDKQEQALESFDEATKLAPQAPGPFQNRGEIYREQKEYAKAIVEFSKVLELQPGVVLPLVHRAEAYLNNGQLEEALADAEAVLANDQVAAPQRVAAHRLRGEILAQLNRLDEAIEEIEQLSRTVPNQPELKMQLALYYLVNKNPKEAISAYDDVLLMDPENFLALRSRGDANLNMGNHAEAIEDFEKAILVEPEDAALLNNLAWVLATSPDAEVRNGERAVELATKACELTDYKMPHILSTLAASFAESGNFDTAIEWSQKAVNMDDPENDEQLQKELASYQKKQPWRERQNIADNGDQTDSKAVPVESGAQSIDF